MLWQIEDLIPTIDAHVVDEVLVSNRGIAGFEGLLWPRLSCVYGRSWSGLRKLARADGRIYSQQWTDVGDGQMASSVSAARMPHSLPQCCRVDFLFWKGRLIISAAQCNNAVFTIRGQERREKLAMSKMTNKAATRMRVRLKV